MDPKVIVGILLVLGIVIYFYLQQSNTEEETPTLTPLVPSAPTADEAPAPPSADDVIKIDGLVAWYDGPSFDDTKRTWSDKSGKDHHITEITGLVEKSKNGEEVQGDVDSIVALPKKLYGNKEYTFISVANYNGTAKERIFTTASESEQNILHGFHGNKTGVYHSDDKWMTEIIDRHGDEWVLSVAQPKLYRSNGALRTAFRDPESDNIYGEVPKRIVINGWKSEKSDWAIKEMIVYDRLLTNDELLAIEKVLTEKYDIKPNRYELSTLTGDASSESWPEIINDMQYNCGSSEALTGFGMTSDHKSQYSCMSGLDLEGSAISGQTIFEKVKRGSEYFENLQDRKIDCGESPINSMRLALDDNAKNIRFEYTCNNSKVKNNTCQTTLSDAYAIGTSISNMSGLTNAKCPAEHVMTSAKLIKDPADNTKQKWELTCCKPKGI